MNDDLEEKERELIVCYSILEIQTKELKQAYEKIKHLEELLKHKAHLLAKED